MPVRLFALISALTAFNLIIAACGDDDSPGSDSTDAQTATASPLGGEGDGDDGDGAGTAGSASVEVSGEISGELNLQGMSCQQFPYGTEDVSDDDYLVSLSGTIGDDQFTIDIGASANDPEAVVSLSRTSPTFDQWDNEVATDDGGFGPRPDSGTVTITDDGGQLDFNLSPAAFDPGTASEDLSVSGSWTCEEWRIFE